MARFSRRFDVFDLDGGETGLAMALQSLKQRGVPVLDMTVSNPTAAGIVYPGDKIRSALSVESVLRYTPEPRGMREARDAVAGYLSGRFGPLDSDDLILTSGTSEAYVLLFALLCNPGDEILVPAPGYPLFDFLAVMADIRLVPYALRPVADSGHWATDFGSMESAITDRTRAIVVIQPHNPTGSILTHAEREQLVALAGQHDLPLVVDEVFCDYIHDTAEVLPVRSSSAPVFTLNGISKVLALPQFKLSWIYIQAPDPARRQAMDRLEILADTLLSVNTPVQCAARELFALRAPIQRAVRDRLEENLQTLTSASLGSVRWTRPEAGWYVILEVPGDSDSEDAAHELLEHCHVYVYPGVMFGLGAPIRLVISLLTPVRDFAEGLARIAARFGNRARVSA